MGNSATFLSALALAAPHLLLAVDPSARAVTEAYTSLKRMEASADTVSLALTMTGKPTSETRALAANLQSVALRQLGINLPLLEEPSQLFAMHSAAQEVQAVSPYFERIQSLARQTAVMHGARRSLR